FIPRQPRLGLLQSGQAGSRRRQSEEGRGPAADQLRHPGSLRGRALQARTLQRRDRRVDTRPFRRRRLDRSGRHRQEDPRREAEAPETVTPEVQRSGFTVPGSVPTLLVIACCAASCAPPLIKLPTGPLTPAADARDAIAEATVACQAVSS